MALTPEQEAQLAALDQQDMSASPVAPGGLSPEQEAQLAALESSEPRSVYDQAWEEVRRRTADSEEADYNTAGFEQARSAGYEGNAWYENYAKHGVVDTLANTGLNAIEDAVSIAGAVPAAISAVGRFGKHALQDTAQYMTDPNFGLSDYRAPSELYEANAALNEGLYHSVAGTLKNFYDPEKGFFRMEQAQEHPLETVLNTTAIGSGLGAGAKAGATALAARNMPTAARVLGRTGKVLSDIGHMDPIGLGVQAGSKGIKGVGSFGQRVVSKALGRDAAADAAEISKRWKMLTESPEETLNIPVRWPDGRTSTVANEFFRLKSNKAIQLWRLIEEHKAIPDEFKYDFDDVMRQVTADGGESDLAFWLRVNEEAPTGRPPIPESPRTQPRPTSPEPTPEATPEVVPTTAPEPQSPVVAAPEAQQPAVSVQAPEATPQPEVPRPVVPDYVTQGEPRPLRPRGTRTSSVQAAIQSGNLDDALKAAGVQPRILPSKDVRPTPARPADPVQEIIRHETHGEVVSDTLDAARMPAVSPPPVTGASAPPTPPEPPVPAPTQPTRGVTWLKDTEIRAAYGMKKVPRVENGVVVGMDHAPMTGEEIAARYNNHPELRAYDEWVRSRVSAQQLANEELAGVYSVEMPRGAQAILVRQHPLVPLASRIRRVMNSLGAQAVREGLFDERILMSRLGEYEPDLYAQYLRRTQGANLPSGEAFEQMLKADRENMLRLKGDRFRYAAKKGLNIKLRESFGLIRDPRLANVEGMSSLIHDIETVRLQRDLSTALLDDGTPFAPTSPTGRKTVKLQSRKKGPVARGFKDFGLLEGRYVTPEEAHYIRALHEIPGSVKKTYLNLLRKWKFGMTVLNPVSHAHQAIGNMQLLLMHHSDPFTSSSARAVVKGIHKMIIKNNDPEYIAAGAEEADFLRAETLKHYGEELLRINPALGNNIMEMGFNQIDANLTAAQRVADKIGNIAGKAKNVLGVPWNWYVKKMESGYRYYDQFARRLRFRQVRYLQHEFARTHTITQDMRNVLGSEAEKVLGVDVASADALRLAMNEAYRVSPNFADVPPIVDWSRKYWAPFMTFQAKMLPTFHRFLLERPLQARLMQEWTQQMEFFTEGIDGTPLTEEQKNEIRLAKKGLSRYMQAGAFYGGKDEEGKPSFVDMGGWNILSGMEGRGWLGESGVPSMVEPSGPVASIVGAAATGNQWPGEYPVVNPLSVSAGEKAGDVVDWASRSFLPSTSPGIPGVVPPGRFNQKLLSMLSGEQYFGRDIDLLDLLAGVREQSSDAGQARGKMAYQNKNEKEEIDRAFRAELKGLGKEPDPEDRAELIERYRTALLALQNRFNEKISTP